MTDLNTILRQQMQNNLTAALDQATQAGDIQAARKAAQQLAEFSVASAAAAPKPPKKPMTVEEIKKALTDKVEWFGIDPRRSAQIVELGKMMDPERFETPEAFAAALIKEYEKDAKRHSGPKDPEDDENDSDSDNENEESDEDNENDEDEGETMQTQRREAQRPARRNGSAQTELNAGSRSTGNNLRRAFETGDIKHLPRAAASDIRNSADKMARNATKEQRALFIQNAVKARARSDLIATGKYNARDNVFKK